MKICGYEVDKEIIIETLNDGVCDYIGYVVDSNNFEKWLDFCGCIYLREDIVNDDDELLISDIIDIGINADEKIFIGLNFFEDIDKNEIIQFYTKLIIEEMLTESTGKNPMDSGGIYGRHWERNQENGITTGEQPIYWSASNTEKTCTITPVVPIFDYLTKTVKYTKECQILESLLPHLNYDILHYIEDIINNPSNYDNQLQIFKQNNLFGSQVSNSYNYETTLTQGMLYVWFEYDGDDYIGISIHNGCDIRGGYTNIHIFQVDWAEDMHMAQFEANIQCKCLMHNYRQLDPNYIVYNNGWDEEVNEKFIYAHSYEDKNGDLRCKYCNELIVSEMIDI